jgi:hypothetical protein
MLLFPFFFVLLRSLDALVPFCSSSFFDVLDPFVVLLVSRADNVTNLTAGLLEMVNDKRTAQKMIQDPVAAYFHEILMSSRRAVDNFLEAHGIDFKIIDSCRYTLLVIFFLLVFLVSFFFLCSSTLLRSSEVKERMFMSGAVFACASLM